MRRRTRGNDKRYFPRYCAHSYHFCHCRVACKGSRIRSALKWEIIADSPLRERSPQRLTGGYPRSKYG